MTSPRAVLRLLAGIAVSVACLYFATRGTDWAKVGGVLADARLGWVLASALAGLFTVYIRAQRWKVLLRPLGDVRVADAFSATAIGFGASAVLPFRVGELVRPAILARHARVRMSAALSSVVLERLFDMLLVIACFFALSLVYKMDKWLRRGAYVLAAAAFIGFVVLLLVQRNRAGAEALTRRIAARLGGRVGGAMEATVHSFLSGLGGVADARTVAVVLAYSVYLWAVIALTFGFGLVALDIDAAFVPASLAVVVLVAVCVFLPQAPGFVGTWQLGCVTALALFHVPKAQAVGFSLVTWVAQMAVNIGTAGFCLAREDVSIGQILRVAERTPAADVEG